MHRTITDCSLCIFCCIAALLFCSCSSEKTETAKTPEQTIDSTPARTAVSGGPGEAVSPTPSGGKEAGKVPETTLRNNPPQVSKVGLRLENVNGIDRLRVVIDKSDKDDGGVSFKYEWTRNDKPAGEGESISGFKRGDRIAVLITPFDDKGEGPAKSLSTEIKNTPPKITEHREIKFDGKVWSYQVKAMDPDGDPLTYSLKTAPQGMTINPATGFIKWEVPPEFVGKAPATVSVSDGQGGEATYNFDAIINAAATPPKR